MDGSAYRISHSFSQDLALSTDPKVTYHTLHPHPALSPVPAAAIQSTVAQQSEHEAQYRQLLVQSTLAVLLPTEDLENACLRTLVADVVAESILGNAIGGRMCEGHFIWATITKMAILVKAQTDPETTGEEIESDTRSRLEKFGLLSEAGVTMGTQDASRRSTLSAIFWVVLQYGYMLFMAVHFTLYGLIAASKGPLRSASQSHKAASSPWMPKSNEPLHLVRPILSFKIFSLMSVILDLPLRMPWLSGSFFLFHYHLVTGPFKLGATDGILDR